MKTVVSKTFCTIGLLGMSVAAMADEAKPHRPPQEPAGFIAGAVIGGFAGGPIGAVLGAGLGTWLGNRVHRASEAKAAEGQVAKLNAEKQGLESDKLSLQSGVTALESERSALLSQQTSLMTVNQGLTAKLEDMSRKAEAVGDTPVEPSGPYASEILDGMQGDVLFRTGSAEISPDVAHQIQVIAQAVAKAPQLKVRLDGYTDPRGSDESNMKLSQERAGAVRDMLLAAGVGEDMMEINAHGKTESVATDSDGYALERKVRLTLRVESPAAVAQVDEKQVTTHDPM